MRAAFGGHLGKEMKDKAEEFARATPDLSKLPEKKKRNSGPALPDLKKIKK